MPHIFRFHKGRNNNIFDWKASDKIVSSDVREVSDKSTEVTSSAGTSIPTPLGRVFLFRTAFEIVAAQIQSDKFNPKSIYAGIVSETLDLLELLYKSGADDNKLSYQNWMFDNSQQDDASILHFFGEQQGHKLLAESFKQAASQQPFNRSIQITLIYYKENGQRILAGGTSPFTFVFTSPNFSRKLRERKFKPISGVTSNDILFDPDYKQLYERDESFIQYIKILVETPGISDSFNGFVNYVKYCEARYHDKFNGSVPGLKDIQYEDSMLYVGNVPLQQLSEQDYRNKVNKYSDFRILLPKGTHYEGSLQPLFLLSEMPYKGLVYTSPSSLWSDKTKIRADMYLETTLPDIMNRELPGLTGLTYPFLSSFDFFERCLIKLPGYTLNKDRMVTLVENQAFLLPIKPLFFYFFPVSRLSDYVTIESKDRKKPNGVLVPVVTVSISIPVHGQRKIVCRKSYSEATGTSQEEFAPLIDYNGIMGIYPLTQSTDPSLSFINRYTIASFEKTNAAYPVSKISFYKKTDASALLVNPVQRSVYDEINFKTVYYNVNDAFEYIQVSLTHNNSEVGGIIIPKFREVKNNGTASYVYAIDFGTSNTHVEFGMKANGRVGNTAALTITKNTLQTAFLHTPVEKRSEMNSDVYSDYENIQGLPAARQLINREYMPFFIGPQEGAFAKFPFKTATYESDAFVSKPANNRLFADANIGFNIDNDIAIPEIFRHYKTDLKWLLEQSENDMLHRNRISVFFRELLMMIRTHALLENEPANLLELQIAMSLPLSMGQDLRRKLQELMDAQRIDVFSPNSLPLKLVTESIAPYYELKSKQAYAQNDIACNIDVGGGTTDIVLVKSELRGNKNTPICNCSSFRFAGRQLWGSGHNAYDADSNGFIVSYKAFIKKSGLNVDSSIFSRGYRTEDLVAVMFSTPSYRFTDIFTEYKELKAVLLVHYCAILYYVTQLARLQNISQPRTVSFSGKGSEYLSIIFPSNASLRGFTQKTMAAFSGSREESSFLLERSSEPKVITAKGAVHYAVEKNSREDTVNWGNDDNEEQTVIYKGFHDLSLEKTAGITYKDFLENEASSADVMQSLEEFFTLLFDNAELCSQINQHLQLKDFARYKAFFIPPNTDLSKEGPLRDSFKATLFNYLPEHKVTDSPFFFALNYSLPEFSKEIANAVLDA